MNLYADVANDPVNLNDPTGEFLGALPKGLKLLVKGGDATITVATKPFSKRDDRFRQR